MTVAEKKNPVDIFMLLPLAAVCVDLLTPYLIWKHLVPAPLRWISHAALAVILFLTVIRMLGYNRFPLAFWFSVLIAALWSFVAVGYGQGLVPTVWGIWLLFQFPFVALFMYLQRDPAPDLWGQLRTFCLVVLVMELGVQLMQYASGLAPGDDLAGFFGKSGSQAAAIFELLVCCLFFGHWIETRRWFGLVAVLAMSMFSSVLSEVKLFMPAMAAIGGMAVILYIARNRAPGKTLLALGLLVILLGSFVGLYNAIVPGAQTTPIQEYITNPSKLLSYMDFSENRYSQGRAYTDMGRFYRVQVGWNSIRNDPLKLIFGYGIGTRSESQSLGTAGVALLAGSQGLSVGSSLTVVMQEMGILGLLLLAGFLAWIVLSMAHAIRTLPASRLTGLRYGLILFTLMWPVWLFYTVSWTMRVSMLLYWLALGYALREADRDRASARELPTNLAMVPTPDESRP